MSKASVVSSHNSHSSERLGADLKIIIIGNSATGKTSIINRYVYSKFDETYKATIASEFSYKIIERENVTYRLQFWDLAGQDRGGEVTKIFARDSHGVILVSDATNVVSREDTVLWKKALEGVLSVENVPIVLMENKCDLLGETEEDYNRDLPILTDFVKKNNIIKGYRTSAKTGFGIEEAMNTLINEMIALNKNEVQLYQSTSDIRGSKLSSISNKNSSGKNGCC